MLTEKVNDWLQIVGMAGIIGSLIFVGLQLKQSQDIAVSHQYQARLDSVLVAKGNMLQSEAFIAVMRKVERGESLGSVDFSILDLAFGQMFDNWESNHFQYVNGYVDEEHWQANLREIDQLLGEFYFSKYWANNNQSYRNSFADVVDSLIENRNDKRD